MKLIPPRADHLPALYAWRSERSCQIHNPLAEVTLENFLEGGAKQGFELTDLKKFESYRFVVELDGEVAGSINLKGISHSMGYAEIGYQVAEKFQGRGVATGMIRALVEKVFRETELRKLFALVHDQNLPSCRVLEKLGFLKEGLLRQHYLIQGLPVNEVFYGLLKADWKP